MKINISPFLALITLLFFFGCNQQIAFERNEKLDAINGWPMDDTLKFVHEFTDTTALHNIFLNVRNTTDYDYSNFYVFFQTRFPDGRLFRDTVEMILADKQGKWTGDGFGKIKSNSFHFRKDVWFPVQGEYEFSIQHAMRDESIKGISDVGIRVEKKN